MLLLLLNDDAPRPIGCELLPAVAVATPPAGRPSVPRTVALPLTSSVLVGVVVLIPILAVVPLPVWLMAEFSMSLAVLHRGMRLTVPPEVVTPEADGGAVVLEVALTLALDDEALPAGAANTNADGGNPPIVSASTAFNA